MTTNKSKYKHTVDEYVKGVLDGTVVASKYVIKAVKHYSKSLSRKDLFFNQEIADWSIDNAQTFKHTKGPLKGQYLKLEPWQMFVNYNLFGFYYRKTGFRRFVEANLFMGRKQGKTAFAATILWNMAILYQHQGSSVYMVAAQLKQLTKNIMDNLYSHILEFYNGHPDRNRAAKRDGWRLSINNNNDSSLSNRDFQGFPLGFYALASNPKAHDSFNGNIIYLDEAHAMPSEEFNVMRVAAAVYDERFILITSTAGFDSNSYYANYVNDCKDNLDSETEDGVLDDDRLFAFLCEADSDSQGNVNYLDPIQHMKANPNYGVSVQPDYYKGLANKATKNSRDRYDFLAKNLNIWVNAQQSYFDVEKFIESDSKFNLNINHLSKLPIKWHGAVDLSKLNDLTAIGLYGVLEQARFEDGTIHSVDIFIPHVFFPINEAYNKVNEDGIPLFAWKEQGALTMSNGNTVDYQDLVNWFVNMRKLGFNIVDVFYDPHLSYDFKPMMENEGFRMIAQIQYGYALTPGFNRIEKKALDGEFYYLHSPAFEYCLRNVKASKGEGTNNNVRIGKIKENKRIDSFMTGVFGANAVIQFNNEQKIYNNWSNYYEKK